MRAREHGECGRCQYPITPGQSIAPRHGGWIHTECAPGGDDA